MTLTFTDNKKSDSALKTISEVSELLQVPQHVLRFWESKFEEINPQKLKGSRRYYSESNIKIIAKIKTLLYEEGHTIKGVQKYLKTNESVKKTTYKEPENHLFDFARVLKNDDASELRKILNSLRVIKEKFEKISN